METEEHIHTRAHTRVHTHTHLTLVLLNPDIPCFANSVDPDQKPTDLDLHCLPSSMQIYNNNLDQVTWLAEKQKWTWHLNLFSRKRVNILNYRYVQDSLATRSGEILALRKQNPIRLVMAFVLFFFFFLWLRVCLSGRTWSKPTSDQ